MSKELIINASLPEIRIALMEDGQVQEILVERPSGRGVVGNLYKGRVTRVLPGMQAAFVDIGLEKAAFLYVDDVYLHPKRQHSDELEDGIRPTHADLDEDENDVDVQTLEGADASEGAESAEQADVAVDAAESNDSVVADESESEISEDVIEVAQLAHPESDEVTAVAEGVTEAAASESEESGEPEAETQEGDAASLEAKKAPRRGRRGGRGRRPKSADMGRAAEQLKSLAEPAEKLPENYYEVVSESGETHSDRADLAQDPTTAAADKKVIRVETGGKDGQPAPKSRPEFREQRTRDRRIKPKLAAKPGRGGPVQIQDLLKEGQEILVQVSKEPISTKGARLTCHVSLPGRHLVCMPTIDHIGVSRRIDRDDERRKLREYVERHRTDGMGFIVRTASGGKDPEHWIQQDVEYLTRLWQEIRGNADKAGAPSMVYEDLNSVLRAIRDWVNEDVSKIVVDSRYHYNEILEFVGRFMPSLAEKLELYQGDIPVFDTYGISTEMHRALERKVWLKSGGSIVIDQAEALVAIDVNTGRFVGKRSLEDTILKTNLEAVEEIAYQLRLRNCGGIIILDFIDMEREEHRMRVYRALEEAIKKDRSRPSITRMSDLGLIEMTRKRTRDTMVRALCEPCSHCEGKGFVKTHQTVAYEALREIEREGVDRESKKILVQAHPDVIDTLAIEERETVDLLEKRYRKQIYLQASMGYHLEQFEISSDRSPGKKGVIATTRSERNQSGSRRDREGRQDRERSERTDRVPPVVKPAGTGKIIAVPKPVTGVVEIKAVSVPVEFPPVPELPPVPPLPDMAALATPVVGASSEDNIGNRVIGTPVPRNGGGGRGPIARSVPLTPRAAESADDALGNRGAPQRDENNPPLDDDFSEEDRLAYLRAQAAQDAALVTFGAAPTTLSATLTGNGRGAGGRGGMPNRGGGGAPGQNRGRSGGRHRRGGGAGGGRNPNHRRSNLDFGMDN